MRPLGVVSTPHDDFLNTPLHSAAVSLRHRPRGDEWTHMNGLTVTWEPAGSAHSAHPEVIESPRKMGSGEDESGPSTEFIRFLCE